MDEISIQIRGKKEVIGWFDRYDTAVVERLTTVIDSSCESIYTKSWSAVPVVTGRLISRINRTPAADDSRSDTGGTSIKGLSAAVKSTAHHAMYVEMGSGSAGAASYPYPRPDWHKYKTVHKWPIRNNKVMGRISQWARLVIGRGKSWQVARSIVERGGVRARPYLYPAYESEVDIFKDGVARSLSPVPPEKTEIK